MEDLWAPPKTTNESGAPRQVGVEIEFGGLGVAASAVLVADVFGGTPEARTAHRYAVTDTEIGTFEIELDARVVHPADGADELERHAKRVIGDLSSVVVPTEIVGPPAPISSLPDFDRLIARLREAGAEGTADGVTHAFGVHLNPEAPSLEVDDIVRVMKAYLLMSPLLRRRIDVDAMRRVLPYIDPFPLAYAQTLLAADFRPDIGGLMEGYLRHNPTRNRELDMLPLFAHLDEGLVRRHLDDPLIQARPTYHYRLPNTNFADPTWGIVKEWNRWVMVERVAADDARLEHLAAEFRRRNPADFLDRMTVRLREWFGGVAGFSD